jgi:predicted RNA-binding protein with PIN domain
LRADLLVKTEFLIDGYNLLHSMGVLMGKVKPLGLERARLRLQEFLVSAFGDEASQATVVFDAARAPPSTAAQTGYKGLCIVLAVGQQTADDVIEGLISHHSSPKHLVVVSSDHRLQKAASRKGAQALSCPEFLDFLDRRRLDQPGPRSTEAEKETSLSEKEISDWLQEFSGLEEEADLKEALRRFDFEN